MITIYLQKTGKEEGVDIITIEDKAAIEKGLMQIKKGQTTPYDEVRKRIHKKLSQYGIQG